MDHTSYQIHDSDPCREPQDRQETRTGSVLDFPIPSERLARRALHSFANREQASRKKPNKAKKLLRKQANQYWPLVVGARVAAISGGAIVQGTIAGTKAHPIRPAAFRRKGFAGCWSLLDSGEHVVGYDLRPLQDAHSAKGQE